MNKKWYVIFTTTGGEKTVKSVLERVFPPEEVKPLLPARKLKERKRGRERERVRLLFPGYVFIKTRMSDSLYRRITSIPSIISLLKSDAEPAEVPEEEMRPILTLTGGREIIDFSKGIKVGTRVKIVDGPLKNLEGYIIDINARKGRARVNLQLLGEGKKVDLGLIVLKRYDDIVNS